MQKYVTRSRVGIFRNERYQPTRTEPNLMFRCVLYHWVHLRQFRYYTKLGVEWANMVQLMQKVLQLSHIGGIRNEHSRCKPLDHKHMFWCIF